jgi:hypothetical protein
VPVPCIAGTLGIESTLQAALQAWHGFGTLSDRIKSGPFETVTHKVSFQVTGGASTTPTWTFTDVTVNPSPTFLSGTRTRTDELLITMGPTQLGHARKGVPPLPSTSRSKSRGSAVFSIVSKERLDARNGQRKHEEPDAANFPDRSPRRYLCRRHGLVADRRRCRNYPTRHRTRCAGQSQSDTWQIPAGLILPFENHCSIYKRRRSSGFGRVYRPMPSHVGGRWNRLGKKSLAQICTGTGAAPHCSPSSKPALSSVLRIADTALFRFSSITSFFSIANAPRRGGGFRRLKASRKPL